jgi:hypothetical protein
MTAIGNSPGNFARVFGVVALLLLLAGCATGGYGSGAAYPGQGQYPGQYPDDRYGTQSLTGTVDGIDLRGQRLLLVTQSNYGAGARVDVFFDRNTRLFHQGREYAIEGLERGDVVRVDTTRSGSRVFARSIEVVRNVRDSYGGGQYGGQYGSDLQGAVGYVDPRARMIELDRGGSGGSYGGYGGSYGGSLVRVRYDERTVVEYQGRRYRPEDLNRGDLVRIQARPLGNEWLAERIWVERSIR